MHLHDVNTINLLVCKYHVCLRASRRCQKIWRYVAAKSHWMINTTVWLSQGVTCVLTWCPTSKRYSVGHQLLRIPQSYTSHHIGKQTYLILTTSLKNGNLKPVASLTVSKSLSLRLLKAFALGNGWGNQELQMYTKHPENISTDGSVLRIHARAENGKYTSARITTLQTFGRDSGYVEATLSVPCAKGIWPAFWSMPKDPKWPYDGEVCISDL